MDATAQTGPTPVFGMFHHLGSQRIPFHVAGHLIEILVRFHRKGLVPPLIDMARSDQVFVLLPSLHVHVGQTLHESRQIAISFWPKHEVPMLCEAPNYVKLG